MANERYTAQEVADALKEAKGFISVAARRLGCVDNTVRTYIDRYAVCRQAILDARESMIDLAEGKLYQNINEGDNTAIIFFLKTQAKHRGYIERVEQHTQISGKDGGEIPIKVVDYRHGITALTARPDDDSDAPGEN